MYSIFFVHVPFTLPAGRREFIHDEIDPLLARRANDRLDYENQLHEAMERRHPNRSSVLAWMCVCGDVVAVVVMMMIITSFSIISMTFYFLFLYYQTNCSLLYYQTN